MLAGGLLPQAALERRQLIDQALLPELPPDCQEELRPSRRFVVEEPPSATQRFVAVRFGEQGRDTRQELLD